MKLEHSAKCKYWVTKDHFLYDYIYCIWNVQNGQVIGRNGKQIGGFLGLGKMEVVGIEMV